MSFVNLGSIDAQCNQNPNPGGFSTALCVTARAIEGSWPLVAFNIDGSIDYANSTINEDNEVTVLPTLRADKNGTPGKWSEYLFPNGTGDANCDSSGDPSYQSFKHQLELMLAGFTIAVRKEMRKHLNAGSVWIFQMKGGEFVVVGSSDDPIFAKSSFKGGKSGKDKRGFTLKGESDGMMWDFLTVPRSLVQGLVINAIQ